MGHSPSWEAKTSSTTKEIPRIWWSPKVHHRIHKSPPPVPVLNKIDPVHVPHPTSRRFISILSSHLRLSLPSGLLSSDFPRKALYAPFLAHIRATCPAHLSLLTPACTCTTFIPSRVLMFLRQNGTIHVPNAEQKFALKQAIKAHRENRSSSTISLTSALVGGRWLTPRPGHFTPGKDTRYPLYRRLGGPQGGSGGVRKNSPLPGFDPRAVQPVACRYADWAIAAHGVRTEHKNIFVFLH
jgi:hypothetical protein